MPRTTPLPSPNPRPAARIRHATARRSLLAAAATLLGLAACGAPKETIAPSAGGGYAVEGDIPYGEGPRRRLDVYRPLGDAGGRPRPIIIYLYGGIWTNGAKDDPSSFVLPQALAARGAVVVVPDVRLYPETGFPGFVEDAAAAVAWTRSRAVALGGDPRGVFVAGHSSGAHTAMLIALDPRWLAAAEADPGGGRRPPLAGAIGISGAYDRDILDLRIVRPVFRAASDRAALLPATFLRPGAPPLLLLHGGLDWAVPPAQSRRLAEAARDARAPADLRIYPGYGHFDILTAGPWLPSLSPTADDVAVFVRRRQAEATGQSG